MLDGYLLFLRIQTGSGKAWFEDPFEKLASGKLDADTDGCSVYNVLNDLEEVQVASAHFATLNRSKVERIYGIKVAMNLIESAELRVDNTPGTTGFSFIDQKHYDITGSKDQFCKLAKLIVERLKGGENLIRYFEESQISDVLSEFLRVKHPEMESRYKDKLMKCLKQAGTPSQ